MGLYKTGKLPARPGAIPLKASMFMDTTKLQAPPAEFGHERMVPNWQMLLNDRVGDCAVAGPLHSIMMWNAEAGRSVPVSNAAAVYNYSRFTGYRPGRELVVPINELGDIEPNPTDRGTDVPSMVKHWIKTGFADATNLNLTGDRIAVDGPLNYHRIGAAVTLEPGNWEQLVYASYYFDGVGIGIECCEEWQTAFANGGLFDAVTDPNVEGGHYICGAAMRDGNIVVVTWGGTIQMTRAGYEQFNDETVAYLSEEKLVNGKDLEGFSLTDLRAALPKLNHIKTLADL